MKKLQKAIDKAAKAYDAFNGTYAKLQSLTANGVDLKSTKKAAKLAAACSNRATKVAAAFDTVAASAEAAQ